MKQRIARYLLDVWYNDHVIGAWLMPLGFLFLDVVRFRGFLYRLGLLKSQRLAVPVIVVGNITVGGTGKTPLTLYLAKLLKEHGFKPAIISRGYGGNPLLQRVTAHSTAQEVGDEALLMAKQSLCPVAVAPLRVQAGQLLLAETDCNILIADDGLQHYQLNRDIEIAVIDGKRRFGNGYCLPAGPLREPISRLQSVDFIVVNGEPAEDNEFAMHLVGDSAINVVTGETKPLSAFNSTCHALAAIGHPQRFFEQLAKAGLQCITHSFTDHYVFTASDITFKDNLPVLMTEKDAVKCANFATHQHWYIPVTAQLTRDFEQLFLTKLHTLKK
ncbi:MAG: tetraacyldisaccharide 4'-kinase [Methylococcaceae bacterium]